MRILYSVSIKLFLCIYILAGILNLKHLDFCSDHRDPLALAFSLGAYILIAIITETELFLIKDITRLWVCFVFWAVHLFIIVMGFLLPEIGFGLLIMIISPCLGLVTTFPGETHGFVFPLFCIIEFSQLVTVLIWDKYVKRKN